MQVNFSIHEDAVRFKNFFELYPQQFDIIDYNDNTRISASVPHFAPKMGSQAIVKDVRDVERQINLTDHFSRVDS